MINKLILNDFQGWEKGIFKFSPGVNIIVGPTDVGKSAIYRSIKWVCENEPAGDEFISDWGDKSKVILSLGKSSKIIRNRSKSINSYKTFCFGDNSEMVIDEYKSFGQGVPEDVQELLNIEDINFQDQLEPPFLLSKSSVEVSKYFNMMVDLDQIDSTLKRYRSGLTHIKSSIAYLSNEVLEAERECKEYDWIDDAEKDLLELEKYNSVILELINQYEAMCDLIKKYEQIEEDKILIDTESADEGLKELFMNQKELRVHKEIRDRLLELDELLSDSDINIAKFDKQVISKQKEYKMKLGDRCPLCNGEVK